MIASWLEVFEHITEGRVLYIATSLVSTLALGWEDDLEEGLELGELPTTLRSLVSCRILQYVQTILRPT